MIFKIKVKKPFYLNGGTILFPKGEAELSHEDLFTPWVKALAKADHFTLCDDVEYDEDELHDLLTEEQAALIDRPVLFVDPPEAVMGDADSPSDQPVELIDQHTASPEPEPEPATEVKAQAKAKSKTTKTEGEPQ